MAVVQAAVTGVGMRRILKRAGTPAARGPGAVTSTSARPATAGG
jgi:hypothetical protein